MRDISVDECELLGALLVRSSGEGGRSGQLYLRRLIKHPLFFSPSPVCWPPTWFRLQRAGKHACA